MFKHKLIVALLAVLLLGSFLVVYGLTKKVKGLKEEASIKKERAIEIKADQEKESTLLISGLTIKDMDEIIDGTKSNLGPENESILNQAILLIDLARKNMSEKEQIPLRINYDKSGRITKMIMEVPDCDKNAEELSHLSDLVSLYSDFNVHILKLPTGTTKTVKIMVVPK